jgi:CBS domain-containing protein
MPDFRCGSTQGAFMSVVDLFNQIAENDFGFFQQVRTVADVMTKSPHCLSLDDNFEAATELLRKGRIHHAPVLNPDDQAVVGIVSDRDLLRHHPRALGKAGEGDDDHRRLKDGVAMFMTRKPVWCSSECSPVKAMTLMLDNHVDSVLVSTDGKTLDGIVTPRNLIKTLLLYHHVCTRDFDLRRLRLVDLDLRNGIPLDEVFSRGAQTVRDVMTKDAVTIQRDELLSTAIARMQELEVRHLPVVNKENHVVGMLSDREILKCLPPPELRSGEPEKRFREVLFATNDKATLHLPVHSVMCENAPSVNPDVLLTDALAILNGTTVSGLSVVDADTRQLCGILTTSDILRVFRVVMQIGSLSEPSVMLEEAEPAVADESTVDTAAE